MEKYDIIIVGSGLGGLECGAILSKEGFNVCVLEKNELLGGCFQTYTRRERLLDTGMHYIGSLDEGQIMNQYFRYFGIMDKLDVRRLDEDCFDQIYYKGTSYDFAIGYDRFVETLSKSFPHERKNLQQYTSLLKEVGSLISVDNLKKGVIAQNGFRFFEMSAAGVIANITSDPVFRNVLAGSSLLYGGIKDVSTFYHHGMVNNSYIEGAYRFIKGSMQVTNALIEIIRTNGGTVRNNSEVTRIIVEDEEVKGVIINHEERIEGKYLISNVHPKRTFELTDKSRSIKNAYLSRINSLDNTYGVFTLYLIMKKDMYPYFNRNIYLHGSDDVWYDKQKCMGKTTSCMISAQTTVPEGEFAEVVNILTPMYVDELLEWKDTTPERRGSAYREFKKEKSNQILSFLKDHGISFEGYVEAQYTTTPLSYRDYTATTDGSAYGIIKNYRYPQVGFVSPRTKISNLLLTGQNLNLHGALGVTLTSMITCAGLVGEEYLAKKVGNA